MRHMTWMLAAIAMTSTTGCMFTDKAGITDRYESLEETKLETAEGSWDGVPIFISNTRGSVQVIGVPGKTNITVSARLAVGANSQEDADAAFADIASTIVLEQQDGLWVIDCAEAKNWHGSVDPATTGCTSLRVEVPAGSVDAPLAIDGYLRFGGFHVTNVTVRRLKLQAIFGIKADVTPTSGAEISLLGDELGSGMCTNVLRLAPETTFEVAELTCTRPDVEYIDVDPNDPYYWPGTYIEGFADAPILAPRTGAYTWSRPGMPASTTKIAIRASMGKALLTTAPIPSYGKIHQCERYEF